MKFWRLLGSEYISLIFMIKRWNCFRSLNERAEDATKASVGTNPQLHCWYSVTGTLRPSLQSNSKRSAGTFSENIWFSNCLFKSKVTLTELIPLDHFENS